MMVLVTGGAACGKSEFAENTAVDFGGNLTYIAAMKPFGAESKERIARHRRLREGKGFETLEKYTDLKSVRVSGTVLLECISNLCANEMFDENGAGENTVEAVLGGIEHLKNECENVVIVTNEVSSDGIQYDEGTLKYMAALGEINRRIAREAQAVYEVVYGIPLKLK